MLHKTSFPVIYERVMQLYKHVKKQVSYFTHLPVTYLSCVLGLSFLQCLLSSLHCNYERMKSIIVLLLCCALNATQGLKWKLMAGDTAGKFAINVFKVLLQSCLHVGVQMIVTL